MVYYPQAIPIQYILDETFSYRKFLRIVENIYTYTKQYLFLRFNIKEVKLSLSIVRQKGIFIYIVNIKQK